MPKHTTHKLDLTLDTSSNKFKDFATKYIRVGVNDALHHRQSWSDAKAHYQRRRYGQEWRNPTFPWPGSSDIVIPLIDKKIDEFKPQLMGLVTSTNTPVTALAIDRPSQGSAQDVELWFSWLLQFGSPRFLHNLILMTDDFTELGRCISKVFWANDYVPAPEVLDIDKLPLPLQKIRVRAKTRREADNMMAQLSEQGRQEVVLIPSEFDQLVREGQIEAMVRGAFQLNPDESKDEVAYKKVIAWLRSGAEDPIVIEKMDALTDVPAMTSVSPMDFVVPGSTQHIEDAEHMTHMMCFDNIPGMIRQSKSMGWNQQNLNQVLDKLKKKNDDGRGNGGGRGVGRQQYQQDNLERQGISFSMLRNFELRETYTWYSSREGAPDQKVVILYHPDYPEYPLKAYKWAGVKGKWPFKTATFELNKPGWYDPRGIPEIIDDMEEEITQNHRNKLNRNAIANAPGFLARQGAGLNVSQFQWVPGSIYTVRDPARDFVPLQIPNIVEPQNMEREEQILRTWVEERLGGLDSGLANPLSSLTEARTAKEIGAIERKEKLALSMRGTLFQMGMSDIYNAFYDMWMVYGPNEVWVQVTGSEPILLTKEQLQGQFVIQPTATIGETDPAAAAQQALARMSVIAEVVQSGMVGDKYELDLGEALRDWIEKDDMRAARRILRERSPEEIQQIQQKRQQEQERAMKLQNNEEMTPEELQIAIKEQEKKAPHGKAQKVNMNG